ncbi:hypothetical protein Tco_0742925 [Tanacetum coccineum]
MQKTILKQQYENFAASRSEGLDKTYDRFQKLISQLEIHGEVHNLDNEKIGAIDTEILKNGISRYVAMHTIEGTKDPGIKWRCSKNGMHQWIHRTTKSLGVQDGIAKVSETETSISKTSKDIVEKPKTVRPSAPIIEDWDIDSDNDSVFRPKYDQTKPKFTKNNFVKSDENVKSVNKENTHRQVEVFQERIQVP